VNKSESQALVVSTEAKLKKPEPDGSTSGYLVITLEQENTNWTIKDIDFETAVSAQEEVLRFLLEDPENAATLRIHRMIRESPFAAATWTAVEE
jgi:hypothetical protein